MSLRLGTTNPSAVRLGSSAATKLMLGTTEVWSAASPPTISYRTTNSGGSYSMGDATYSALDVGTAASNRVVLICINARGFPGGPSAVNVNGASASLISSAVSGGSSSTFFSSIWAVALTSGTTADVVVTWAAAGTWREVSVYAAYGISTTATDTSSVNSPSAPSDTLTAVANGIGVGSFASATNNDLDVTWTGFTRDYQNVSTSGQNDHASAASASGLGTSVSISANASGSTGFTTLAAATFPPA